MTNINIPCTKAWFERIKAGQVDLRPITPYWTKRLKDRTYDTITFTLGYPKASNEERRYTIPFYGCFEHQGMYVILTTKPKHD